MLPGTGLHAVMEWGTEVTQGVSQRNASHRAGRVEVILAGNQTGN